MPFFCVKSVENANFKSVKIYAGQKNLHKYTRGVRDKYEVCVHVKILCLYYC